MAPALAPAKYKRVKMSRNKKDLCSTPKSTNISPNLLAVSLMRKEGLEPSWAIAHKNLKIQHKTHSPLNNSHVGLCYCQWHRLWHHAWKWILNPVHPVNRMCMKLRAAALKYLLSRLIAWVAVCAVVCHGVAVGSGNWVSIVRGGHECGHVFQSTNPGVPGERVW